MKLSLSPELELFLQQRVGTERYPTAEAVIEAGLRLMQQREAEEMAALKDLQGKVHVGMDQLERGEFTECQTEAEVDAFFEDVKKRGRAGLAAKGKERRSA